LALVLSIGTAGAVSVNAAPAAEMVAEQDEFLIMPLLDFINITTTQLRIEPNGRVTMTGSILGYNGLTTRVSITLHLERRATILNSWSTVASEPTRTLNSFTGAHQATRTITASGQYRVRAVYRAYAGNRVETITAFSGTVRF